MCVTPFANEVDILCQVSKVGFINGTLKPKANLYLAAYQFFDVVTFLGFFAFIFTWLLGQQVCSTNQAVL